MTDGSYKGQIDGFLKTLIEKGGSDLHLCIDKPPYGRLKDNLLHPLSEKLLSKTEVEGMLAAALRIDSVFTKLMEKEEIDTTYEGSRGRFRVNIGLSRGVPFATFRELKSDIPSPVNLGIKQEFLDVVENANYGVILIVGTTGSGKSMTMASTANHILTLSRERVITIEDPVEYIIGTPQDVVSQREVGKDTLSFASGLRAAMREDPDYIVVGEVRDLETARMAVLAAETGHVVFVTLHAKDSVSAISRYCGMFPIEEQLFIKRRLLDVLSAVQTQFLVTGVDKKKRYLVTELLVLTDEIREMVFGGKLKEVRQRMEKGECGWVMEKSAYELKERGAISDAAVSLFKAYGNQ